MTASSPTPVDSESLSFIRASKFGSRRKEDGDFSSDLSDIMDLFETGDENFASSIFLKKWVGGNTLPNEAAINYPSPHHQKGKAQEQLSPISKESITNAPIPSSTTSGGVLKSLAQTIPMMVTNLDDELEKDAICTDPLFTSDERSDIGPDMTCAIYSKSSSHKGSSSSTGSHRHPKRDYKIIQIKKMGTDNKLDPPKMSKSNGNDALGIVLSALYGKLLVVMGLAFPMSEVISTYIPPSFYDGFYLYLYFGSIIFMICIYGNTLSQKASRSVRYTMQRFHSMRSRLTSTNSSGVQPDVTTTADVRRDSDHLSCSSSSEGTCTDSSPPSPLNKSMRNGHIGSDTEFDGRNTDFSYLRIHFGSFYLRMGAVVFGIGSMIYSGLEFGQYFELEPGTKCSNINIALTPAVRMIFTFMQMYFIFMNSKLIISKVRIAAQFGLMHMIGTNLCVWTNVLVQETRHEILHFYNPDNNTMTDNYINLHYAFDTGEEQTTTENTRELNPFSTFPPNEENTNVTGQVIMAIMDVMSSNLSQAEDHRRVKRGLRGPHSLYECRRTDIMGALVQNASPFLFPCTIEYSLICAAILYVMWKSMAKNKRHVGHNINSDAHLPPGVKRSPNHYSVDCARANKGLFLGIFILVMTIISLILYFVLITRPEYQALATLEINITELVLYTTTTVAVLIGICQIRELRFLIGRNLELDNILLIVAQTGSFIYNVFTVIGGHFTLKKNTVLVMMTALASLIQLFFQTLFILDASKRCAATPDQVRRKPGREVVTFLLVCNLAMWAINTLEKSRADSHPVQLKFYGVWAWTIITHISMPLAIFYRFHSTVCLCEIWKKAYKLKPSSYR